MKKGILTLELGRRLKPHHERAGLSLYNQDCFETIPDVYVHWTMDDLGVIDFNGEDLRKILDFTTLWWSSRQQMLETMKDEIRSGEERRTKHGGKFPWEHPDYGKVPAN